MRKLYLNLFLTSITSCFIYGAYAQNVGINTTGANPHASSMLDVDASDKGVLLPRISLIDVTLATPVTSPATGLLIYNTNAAIAGGFGEGFYYWSGSAWAKIVVAPSDDLFIRNQNTTDQTGNYRITGTGRANTSIQSPLYTRADAGIIGIRPNTDAVAAIQLQNAAGNSILNVDAINGRIGIGTDMPSVSLDVRTTDAIKIPSGTTVERPSLPLAGATRFNTENKALEYYDGTQWVSTNMEQTPVGTIIPFAGSSIPSGWLLCDGSAVSRTTYQTLFNAVGANWGSGDGSTTFNLPDLRGRFLRGVDGAAGRDPDAGSRTASNAGGNTANDVGSTQGDAVASHTHDIAGNTNGSGVLNTQSGGDHSHNVDPPNTATTNAGSHQHVLKTTPNDVNTSSSQGFPAGNVHTTVRTSDRGATNDVNINAVTAAGDHAHTVDVGAFTSGTAGAHAHSISDHNHAINLTSGAPSSTTTSENRPKNVNVTYIIKATSTSSVAITSVNVGSGIFGQTLYNNGSNWMATSNLYNSGTQIAIGNTAPQQALSITGGVNIDQDNTNAGSVATTLTFGSTSGEGVGSKRTAGGNQNGLDFYTQSANRMSITSAGNVGIGTITPLSKLHITNTSNTDGLILQNNNGGAGTTTNISFATYADITTGTSRPGARMSGIDDGNFSSHLSFLTKVPGADVNLLTERMRIISSGNVGIGTGSPSSLFHVAANEGDGITIGKPNDAMGSNGGAVSIRFYGYRDVTANGIGAKISAERTDVCCGYLSQGVDLAFYTNAGLNTPNADNSIERLRIKDNGNIIVSNLAGTGNRPVYADATGTLKAGSKGVAFSQDRTEFVIDASNLGFRNVGTPTGNLAVETGDVVVINVSFKFRWNGGSGGDHPRFGVAISGCATTSVDDAYYHRIADDLPRNEYQTLSYQYVYTATCTGNIQFTLRADTNTDGDDNSGIGDLVIVATRY